MAISAALRVWPALHDNMKELGMTVRSNGELDDDSVSWLVEKLSALASITQHGNEPDKMLGCDAVFLARLLLEEQRLDAGRNSGRGGKYGGKFHPQQAASSSSNGSVVGSRPLTTGVSVDLFVWLWKNQKLPTIHLN